MTASSPPPLTTDLFGRTWIEAVIQSCPHPQQLQRQQALARLGELGIPTRRDEAWKYTDLSDLIATPHHRAEVTSLPGIPDTLPLWPEVTQRMVLVNGHWQPHLSTGDMAGIHLEEEPGSLGPDPDAWGLLNAACSPATLVVNLKGISRDPLHLLCLTTDPQPRAISHPRIRIQAAANSQAILIEDHRHWDPDAHHLTNAVTSLELGPNAQVEHILLQGGGSHFLTHTHVQQERDSRYINHTLQWGSQLTRHSLHVVQTGSQAETILNELASMQGREQANTYSVLDHRAPHGRSQQQHRCVAQGHSRGSFNGTLRVRQAAQQTDASQSSRNLLLSDKARIYTRPQLEIVADDVKCAHGATISQLEDDELFYLQSRGIGLDQAKSLLTYGFVAELIDRIPVQSVREWAQKGLTS